MDEQGFNEAEAEKAICAGCATPLLRRPQAGSWRHEHGMVAGACGEPVPMVPTASPWVN